VQTDSAGALSFPAKRKTFGAKEEQKTTKEARTNAVTLNSVPIDESYGNHAVRIPPDAFHNNRHANTQKTSVP